MSAKPRSARRKKNAPLNKATKDITIVMQRRLGFRTLWPSTAHRKPSMNPTAGFKANNGRHCSGIMLIGYTTGLAYIQT